MTTCTYTCNKSKPFYILPSMMCVPCLTANLQWMALCSCQQTLDVKYFFSLYPDSIVAWAGRDRMDMSFMGLYLKKPIVPHEECQGQSPSHVLPFLRYNIFNPFCWCTYKNDLSPTSPVHTLQMPSPFSSVKPLGPINIERTSDFYTQT